MCDLPRVISPACFFIFLFFDVVAAFEEEADIDDDFAMMYVSYDVYCNKKMSESKLLSCSI